MLNAASHELQQENHKADLWGSGVMPCLLLSTPKDTKELCSHNVKGITWATKHKIRYEWQLSIVKSK